MRIGLDLDGTLYDSLNPIFAIDSKTREILGYKPISVDAYRQNFNPKDWNAFYRSLGVRDEDLQKVIDMFVEEFRKAEAPPLIPGAREALQEIERKFGDENIYIITNEPKKNVEKRFSRDGLLHYMPRVVTPFQGKADELHRIAIQHRNVPFAYVGDLVADGEDCLEARKMGADNLLFYAILHKYAMNDTEHLVEFAKKNKGFAKTLNNLREISAIWTP